MHRLSIFAALGALMGVVASAVLFTMAFPAYSDYLLPLSMYQDKLAMTILGESLIKVVQFETVLAIAVPVWLVLWFMVAGQLNPALARLPFARGARRGWAWAAWLAAAMLFGAAVLTTSVGLQSSLTGMTADSLWLLGVLGGGMAWLLVSPQGFGRFAAQTRPRPDRIAVLRVAGLGMLFVGWCALVIQVFSTLIVRVLLTYVNDAWFTSTEPSLRGWFWLASGIVLSVAIATALAFGLLPLFVPGQGHWRTRAQAARPGLLLAAVVVVAGLITLPLLISTNYLGRTTLVEAAGLQSIRPLAFHTLRLCAASCASSDGKSNPGILQAGPRIDQVHGLGALDSGVSVPLHPDVVPALDEFATGPGRHSVLRKSAQLSALEIHDALWEPQQTDRLHAQLVQRGEIDGFLIYQQVRLARLMQAAPINAESRAMLEQLSDPRQFHVSGKAAVKLAAAWARFGDTKRARNILSEAQRQAPGRFDNIQLPVTTLRNGSVSGRLALAGQSVEGVRVGLFRMTNDDPTRPNEQSAATRFTSTPVSRLSSSVVLKSDGRFVFSDLSNGDYFLALLIPADLLNDRQAIRANPIPDRIEVSTRRPQRELGLIQLTAHD